MRLGQLFVGPILAAFAISGLASAGPTGSKFAALSSRQGGAVDLSSSAFGELTDAPRDTGAAILFTTGAAGAQCEACRQVDPHWKSLSKQWSKRRDPSLVFGTLDFFQSRDVFTRVSGISSNTSAPLNFSAGLKEKTD